MLWGIMGNKNNIVIIWGIKITALLMGSREISVIMCVVCYSVLLALHGTAKEKWWQVRTNITGTGVFVIPSSTSVA